MFGLCLITTVADEKTGKHINSASAKEVNAISENPTVSSRIPGKLDGPAVSPRMTTLELKNPTNLNTKDSHSCLQQTCLVLPSDAWLQVWSKAKMHICNSSSYLVV